MDTENHKYVNILLLGEIGIGKSTLINSFANYARFDSLNDAEDCFECLVPTKFVVCTADGETNILESTSSDMTSNKTAIDNVSTQDVRIYEIPYNGKVMRLIDTPGITSTVFEDNANCTKVLQFIASLKHIDGVCVLIKPDLARITSDFMYSILLYITKLGHAVAENIIFLFTRTRKSNYMALDTITSLQPVLEEIAAKQKLRIPLRHRKSDCKNCFCFENESYNYLIARKQNIQISTSMACLKESWSTSRNSMRGLFDYIAGDGNNPPLRPYILPNMALIETARALIFEMTLVLIDVASLYRTNINLYTLSNVKCQDKNYCNTIFKPNKIIKAQVMDQVGTCTKCVSDCNLTSVQEEFLDNGVLKHRLITTCKECYCDSNMHLYRYYSKQEVNNTDKNLIPIDTYYDEYQFILTALLTFNQFLDHHSFKDIEDVYEVYLTISIANKKDADQVRLKCYQMLQRDYKELKLAKTNILNPTANDIIALAERTKRNIYASDLVRYLHALRKECHQIETPINVEDYARESYHAQNMLSLPITCNERDNKKEHIIHLIMDDKMEEAFEKIVQFRNEYLVNEQQPKILLADYKDSAVQNSNVECTPSKPVMETLKAPEKYNIPTPQTPQVRDSIVIQIESTDTRDISDTPRISKIPVRSGETYAQVAAKASQSMKQSKISQQSQQPPRIHQCNNKMKSNHIATRDSYHYVNMPRKNNNNHRAKKSSGNIITRGITAIKKFVNPNSY